MQLPGTKAHGADNRQRPTATWLDMRDMMRFSFARLHAVSRGWPPLFFRARNYCPPAAFDHVPTPLGIADRNGTAGLSARGPVPVSFRTTRAAFRPVDPHLARRCPFVSFSLPVTATSTVAFGRSFVNRRQ